MKSRVACSLALALVMVSASASVVTSWATATSTNATNGRVIIFRYPEKFAPAFKMASLPDRVTIQWHYDSEAEKGMPLYADRVRMDEMEDLLEPVLEIDNLAVLALVSTGEHMREWIYYTKSESQFLERLNTALAGHPAYPLQIQTARDPTWQSYREFKSGLAK